MNVARFALLVPLLALIALSGCRTRAGSNALESDELRAENQRLTGEVDRLTVKNTSLAAQLQSARDELANKGPKNDTVGNQFKKILDGEEIPGTTRTESGGLALAEDFAFAKGSDELNAEGQSSIAKIAARLNSGDYASARVVVEGHTDDTPVARASTKEKFKDNWGLSGARSAAVIRALQAAGVKATRIQGQFRGEYAPRGGDKTANRRVEIYLAD
jgi:flagellar motor protein MotB